MRVVVIGSGFGGLAAAVRRRPEGAQLPMLALTTLSDEIHRERALAQGFDAYLVKVERTQFLAMVRLLLQDLLFLLKAAIQTLH